MTILQVIYFVVYFLVDDRFPRGYLGIMASIVSNPLEGPRLTKSDFLDFLACEGSFALRRMPGRVRQRPAPDAFARLLAEDGKAFEQLARGHLARDTGDGHYEFEQSFDDGRCRARADAVKRNKDGTIDMIEIKASTSPDAHIVDAAFQVLVAERAGERVRSVAIAHANPDYVRGDALDPSELVVVAEVTEDVRAMLAEIEPTIERALGILAGGGEPPTRCDCRHRSRASHCEHFAEINSDIPETSAHLLPRISPKRLAALDAEGRLEIARLTSKDVTTAQLPVLEALRTGRPVVDRAALTEFCKSLRFPLHFYDYETMGASIPHAIGHRPHEQIPVQFSLHTAHEDGRLDHHEFLAEDYGEESALVDALLPAIGNEGTAIVWNAAFEKAANRRLARLLPHHADRLADLDVRTEDLMLVFKRALVHPGFRGSVSIKRVLPVLCPDLAYDQNAVHDGAGAMAAFQQMARASQAGPREELRRQLRAYCRLDTLAMVAIHREVVRIAGGGLLE